MAQQYSSIAVKKWLSSAKDAIAKEPSIKDAHQFVKKHIDNPSGLEDAKEKIDEMYYEGQFHHTYAGDASVKKDVSDAMSKLDEARDTIKRGLRVRSSSSLSLPSSQEGGKRTRRHRRQRKSNKRRSKHVRKHKSRKQKRTHRRRRR